MEISARGVFQFFFILRNNILFACALSLESTTLDSFNVMKKGRAFICTCFAISRLICDNEFKRKLLWILVKCVGYDRQGYTWGGAFDGSRLFQLSNAT